MANPLPTGYPTGRPAAVETRRGIRPRARCQENNYADRQARISAYGKVKRHFVASGALAKSLCRAPA